MRHRHLKDMNAEDVREEKTLFTLKCHHHHSGRGLREVMNTWQDLQQQG